MSENSIQLSKGTLTWILVCILLFVILIIAFSRFDTHRKYQQFKQLNETVQNSEHLTRIAELLNSTSITDTASLLKVQEALWWLEDDLDNKYNATVYLPYNSTFLAFYCFSDFDRIVSCDVMNHLPKDIKLMKNYLDSHHETDFKELFIYVKDHKYVNTLVKVGKGYLYIN